MSVNEPPSCLIYPDTIIYPDTVLYPNGLCPPDLGQTAWVPLTALPRRDKTRTNPRTS